jgi:hypothetical protein
VTIATQATLAALLAKTLAAPATEAKQDTGNTSLATIATQTAGLATAAGLTSTGSKLDTLHADLIGALTTRGASTTVSGSLAALNASVDGTTDLAAYTSVRLQITGTWVGTIQFQSSVDGTNWASRLLTQSGTTTINLVNSATTNGVVSGDIGGRYFRTVMTAYTSGTAAITAVYSTAASPAVSNNVALLAGTARIGYFAAGTTLSATLAATTNATNVLGSAGTLYNLSISNPTAATVYFKLYNKASSPTVGTDVPVITIPVAASTNVMPNLGSLGQRFSTGISYACTAAFAATDTAVIGAGVQVAGTYF